MISAEDILNSLPGRDLKAVPLSAEERRLCVEHFRNEDPYKPQPEVAALLGVCTRTVRNDLVWLHEEKLKTLAPIVTDNVVKSMTATKNYIQALAIKKQNIELYWKIEMEYIDKLGKMGFVPYKSEPINLHIGDKHETHVTNVRDTTIIAAGPGGVAEALNGAISDIKLLQELAGAGSVQG